MSVGSVNLISQNEVTPQTAAPTTVQTPTTPKLAAIETPKDSVSFGKKNKKKEAELTYEKTGFYKKMGLISGGVLGLGGLASILLATPIKPLYKGLLGAACVITAPLLGLANGIIPDYMFNKQVKNTVDTLNNNFDLKRKADVEED